MGCDSTSLFCYSQSHRPLIHHWPLACLQISSSSFRLCSGSTEGAVQLWSVIPPVHQRGAFQSAFLPYIKVGKGELITGSNYQVCEDFRPRHEELVLAVKLLKQALSLKCSLGIALRMCRLNTFSALSLPISSCVDGVVWEEIQIK